MSTIQVPLSTLREILTVLNEVPNQRYPGDEFRTTYDLAAEVSRLIRGNVSRAPEPRQVT